MGINVDHKGTKSKKVVIFGGGLAGISAAKLLIEQGYSVSLVEKRPFLGGRAYSFSTPELDTDVDNGQHVFMGCCTSYLRLIRELGSYGTTFVQENLKIEVLLGSQSGWLTSWPWLKILHMLPALIGYPHLGILDKIRVFYGLACISLDDRRSNSAKKDGENFLLWLKQHYQSNRAIKNFWNLIILPSLNDNIENVNTEMAMLVLQEGFLSHPKNSIIGFGKAGLDSLTTTPAENLILKGGGTLLLGKTVRKININEHNATSIKLSDGSTLEADAFISALPFDVLLNCLPIEQKQNSFFSTIQHLKYAPIVNIHFWYDKPVMSQAFVSVLNSPIQWVFNRSEIQSVDQTTLQHLCISLSGAWEFVGVEKSKLIELFTNEMHRVFPEAKHANVQKAFVIKQPNATFRSLPESGTHRPSQITPIPNFYLAGDWTNTGWPSTMESAVRSGELAAQALMSKNDVDR